MNTIAEFKKRVKLSSRVGGCLNGYLDISYDKLVELLGKPNVENDGYKTDAEWCVSFDDIPFSIYNYKDGKSYNKVDGLNVEDIRNWNIGGRDKAKAKELAEYLLNLPEK